MEGSVSFRLLAASAILILISDTIGHGVLGCPSVCLCYVDENGLRTANCSGVKFMAESKFNKLFHEIEVLNLRTNDDDEPIKLWDDMFTSFSKLKVLNLDKCRISYLPKNVFKGLKKIYEINLSSNDIRHFDNSVFENIYTLNRLNLRGNQLQGSSKPFISSSSLRELDIGYCGMTVLQNEFFHGVKKLNRLLLDGNHLQTVKEHVLPRGITHLNLANNRIINVPISTIYSLNQLRSLDLGANPINCTCALMNLQDILSRHATIIEGDIRCAYPPELENLSLYKVNENELCNKETFSSRYHFKKSQTSKYSSFLKKGDYFDNEKYNPFEVQGDDPGTSTDDYSVDNYGVTELHHNHDGTSSKPVNEDILDQDVQITTIKKSANRENYSPEAENLQAEELHQLPKNSDFTEKKIVSDDIKHFQSEESSSNNGFLDTNTDSDKNDNTKKLDDGVIHETYKEESENGEKGPTPIAAENVITSLPFNSEDVSLNVPLDDKDEKSDILDKNISVADQVIPVNTVFDEATTTGSDHSSEKIQINNSDQAESNLDNGSHVESVSESKGLIDYENSTDIQGTTLNKNNSKDNNDKTDKDTGESKSGNDPDLEIEGSGGSFEEIVTGNQSIPIVGEDESAEHFLMETTQQPVSEIPIHIADVYPVHTHDESEDKSHDSEETGQIVEKEPIDYGEMGPYIVVACIILFITILIFIALYKGLCKSKNNNRKSAGDVEAINGTELQDITSSLLPKSQVNGDTHNNKYPNEIPSHETINLIKPDKAEDVADSNKLNKPSDLKQNGNKTEPIVKNGKPAEGSSPPFEITKAKVSVLLESIPQTPIFVQKRPTMLNNG